MWLNSTGKSFRNLAWLLSSWVIIALSGCSLFQTSQQAQERRAAFELKKQNFVSLRQSLIDHLLDQGAAADLIVSRFGKPDDIFHSGSTQSRFEIWTYEQVISPDHKDWQPIRLYINDGRLTSWKY